MAQPIEITRTARRRWVVVVGMAAILMAQAPGCSCRQETAAERAARIAKQEAEQLELKRKQMEEARLRQPVQLPNARLMPAGKDTVSLFVKPGHWNAIRQPATGGAENFDGVLSYEVRQTREGAEGSGLRSRLVSRRPLVVAAKGEKSVDSLFYCPPTGKLSPRLVTSVLDRRSGVEVLPEYPLPLRALRAHQYHFVVLAREPGRYGFLDAMYSFNTAMESRIDASDLDTSATALPARKNYRLVAVPTGDAAVEPALPDNPLAWTSIAYVLWDDVDPEVLLPAQREAMIDWLNWGGQLLVSGPNSLELLRGSFLEDFLPAISGGSTEIDAQAIKRLEQNCSAGTKGDKIDRSKPWTGVELQPTEGARPSAGLEGLAVERRVGRGRIVVSAFPLDDPRLLAWSAGVENFYNAVLLRRPPRRFVRSDNYDTSDRVKAAVHWARGPDRVRLDPLWNTHLRTFVRDSYRDPNRLATRLVEEASDPAGLGGFTVNGKPPGEPTGFLALKAPAEAGGAGAIRDFGPVANAARETLRESAGVSIPNAGFVIGCLAAYLFFLVPANWALFAGIGRVELAWVAAPFIAIVGALVVIQQAQLDIGFVRSRTEVAVLELQPDTQRGMLTRFSALYTSLSTTYQLEFDNPAIAAPFPRGTSGEGFGDAATVAYERQEKTRLRDVAVSSATTEFLRSEEMIDLAANGLPGSSIPGRIGLKKGPSGQTRLENRTQWLLEDAIVVGRPDGLQGEPRLEGCWVGDLAAGGYANLAFLPIEVDRSQGGDSEPLPFDPERKRSERTRGVADRLGMTELLRIALDPKRFEPGERRVIAIVRQILLGLAIEPAASQRVGATMVVGHLGYGPLPAPVSDANGPLDIR